MTKLYIKLQESMPAVQTSPTTTPIITQLTTAPFETTTTAPFETTTTAPFETTTATI